MPFKENSLSNEQKKELPRNYINAYRLKSKG